MRYKSPSQIVAEIENIYEVAVHNNYIKQLFLTDDNLVGQRARIVGLLKQALIPMNRKHDISGWTCQCSVNVAKDEELLALMRQAGCQHIFIGFETLSAKNLSSLGKGINRAIDYSQAISKIRAHGIDVIGSFILGNDADDVSSFARLVKFIDDNALLDNLINILVPFPGTKLFKRFQKEGRILHYEWSKYDLGHVVFQPKQMSIQELEEGYVWVHQEVYRLKKLHKKLKTSIWQKGKNKLPFKFRIMFTLRLLTYLSGRDWDRSSFVLRVIPDIFNPNLAMQVSNIVNCLDHQDFARELVKQRRRRLQETVELSSTAPASFRQFNEKTNGVMQA